MSPSDLSVAPVGTIAYFHLNVGSHQPLSNTQVAAKFSSAIKSYFTRTGGKCAVGSAMLHQTNTGGIYDPPSCTPVVVVTVLEAGSREKQDPQEAVKETFSAGERVKYSNVNWPDKIIEAIFVRYHTPKVAIVRIDSGEEKKIPTVRITSRVN